MAAELQATPHRVPQAKEPAAASLLVRCWLESPGSEDEPPVVRGYVRNLRTGEELFIKDLESIGQQIRRQLSLVGAAAEPGQEDESGRSEARQGKRR